MSTTPTTIADTDFEGKVRAHDPLDTSWEAAALQTRGKTKVLKVDIEAILRTSGPLNDDELIAKYELLHKLNGRLHPKATPQSIRTRRKELCNTKPPRVVGAGFKRPSANGGPSAVWKVREA